MLLSLSIMSSRFIHVVAWVGILFPFWGWMIFHCVCVCIYIHTHTHTYHFLFIHSSVTDIGRFCFFLAIVNWLQICEYKDLFEPYFQFFFFLLKQFYSFKILSYMPFKIFYLFIFLFYFYSFPFIFISWRLITLQYCSGFCHTLTSRSRMSGL